jgi:hypothetical protein
MDSQILGLIGFAAILGLGLWLIVGKPGNKKRSGDDPDNFHSDGTSLPP